MSHPTGGKPWTEAEEQAVLAALRENDGSIKGMVGELAKKLKRSHSSVAGKVQQVLRVLSGSFNLRAQSERRDGKGTRVS